MRLRTALTAAIFTAAAAAAGAAFIASWWIGGQLVKVSVHEQLSSDMAQLRLQIEREAEHALILAKFVSATPEFVEAFAKDDRGRLLAMVQPGFALARASGIAQFHFHKPPAVSFLRVHTPEKFGDDISDHRHMVVAANKLAAPVRGVEIGVGGLGVRAASPVFEQGKHIGSVEFGMALDQKFLDQYSRLTGQMTAIILLKDGQTEVHASTLPSGLDILSGDIEAALEGQQRVESGRPAGDQCYGVIIEPLRDYSGKIIGALALAVNRSPLDAIHRKTIMIFGALCLMVLCIGGISAWRINRDLGGPLAKMTQSMSDLAEGRLDVKIDTAGRIVEIKEMAHALHVFAQALAAKREGDLQVAAAKARFEALIQATAEVVWTVNARGEMETDSPSWRGFTGLTFDEYKGMAWLDAIHPDDREKVLSEWRCAIDDCLLFRSEYRLRHASGEWRWILASAVPLFDEKREVREWVCMSADITEQKEADDALRRVNRALMTLGAGNEALLRAENERQLLEDMCRVLVDTGGYRVAWIGLKSHDNSGGVKPDACVGLEDNSLAEELLCPSAGRSQRPASITLATGETQVKRSIVNDPGFAACAHGMRDLKIQSIATLALKKEGEIFGVCVVYSTDEKAFDEDEIKLLEQLVADLAYGVESLRANVGRKVNMERLHAAAHYIRSLFEASLDMFVTIGPDGSVADVNRASERILGAPPEKTIGRDFANFFTDPPKARAGLREAFAKGAITDLTLAVRRPSGEVTSLLCNASVFRDQRGAVVGVFAAGRDVTELQRVQNELRSHREHLEDLVASRTQALAEANEQLVRANEEMEAFSYSVSHDLRVPLRAVDGFSRAVLEDYQDKLDDDGKRLLGVVHDNAVKMGVLIDDILAFSRISRAQIEKEPVDMNHMVQSVQKELDQGLAPRKVAYTIETLPCADADPAMIRRVWTNLLDNAIKYTSQKPDARIEIGSYTGDKEIIFYVKDNGTGFDMKYAHKLFGVFQRLHGQEFSGTGIGLANVKRIVTRHGGRVWAEAKPNEGATFYFSLPSPTLKEASAAA